MAASLEQRHTLLGHLLRGHGSARRTFRCAARDKRRNRRPLRGDDRHTDRRGTKRARFVQRDSPADDGNTGACHLLMQAARGSDPGDLLTHVSRCAHEPARHPHSSRAERHRRWLRRYRWRVRRVDHHRGRRASSRDPGFSSSSTSEGSSSAKRGPASVVPRRARAFIVTLPSITRSASRHPMPRSCTLTTRQPARRPAAIHRRASAVTGSSTTSTSGASERSK